MVAVKARTVQQRSNGLMRGSFHKQALSFWQSRNASQQSKSTVTRCFSSNLRDRFEKLKDTQKINPDLIKNAENFKDKDPKANLDHIDFKELNKKRSSGLQDKFTNLNKKLNVNGENEESFKQETLYDALKNAEVNENLKNVAGKFGKAFDGFKSFYAEKSTVVREKLEERKQAQAKMQADKEEAGEEKASGTESETDKNGFTSRGLNFLKESWYETFPQEKDYVSKYKDRIEEIKRQRELEEEYENNGEIPEWKRGALIVTDIEAEPESRWAKFKRSVKSKFDDTDTMKEFYKSDSFKEFSEARSHLQDLKGDIQTEVDHSQSPLVAKARGAYDMIFTESNTAQAIRQMQSFDPDFEIEDFLYEARDLFEMMYTYQLHADIETLSLFVGEQALAFWKNILTVRTKTGIEPKYKEVLSVDDITFMGGRIPDKKNACFTFSCRLREIHCNVKKGQMEEIVEGDEERVSTSIYSFTVTLHSDPALDQLGHPWEIVDVQQMDKYKALF